MNSDRITDNRLSWELRFNDYKRSLNEAAQAKCSYQPQRATSSYGWLPWAAFVLAMALWYAAVVYFTHTPNR